MRFQAEEGTDSLTVGGQRYAVDEDGTFECDNHEHFGQLRQLGCKGEGEHVHRGPVVADEPPAIPEGYASEEVVRALIEENEDQKVAIGKLNSDVEALRGELSSSQLVETELRERIAELTGQLETATDALSSATEKMAGTTEGRDDALQAVADENAVEEAPPAAGKAKAK